MNKNMNKAMRDWFEEMRKLGDYFPPIWPTENIMKWGQRMETEQKEYNLTDDEWLTVETKKTELCLRYGRKPVDPRAIKCPKYHTYDYHGPGGLSVCRCYNDHPWDEDIYTCEVTGKYPCCEGGFILQGEYDRQLKKKESNKGEDEE